MFHVKLTLLAVIATVIIASTNAKQLEIEPRIKNGQYAERGQFPFFVYLEMQSTLLTFQFQKTCGASLISDEWVLTAAHCVSNDKAKIRLHLGSLNANDENEVGRQIIDISSDNIHVYPNYSAFLGISNPKHDIALIKLPSPVEFNKYIRSVPLACPKSLSFGGSVIAVGNGNGKSNPPVLQYADLKVTELSDNFIFTVGLNKQSTKVGDLGGPLVVLEDNGEVHGQIGIITSGHYKTKFYGDFKTKAFTRIAAYFDWITSITGITTCLE